MRREVLAVLLGPEDEVLVEWVIPRFLDRLSLAQVDRARLLTADTANDVIDNALIQVDYEYDAVESELQRMVLQRHDVCFYRQRHTT